MHVMLSLLRLVIAILEHLIAVPVKIVRGVLDVFVFNPRLGPLRYIAGFALAYVAFALILVYPVAFLRGFLGGPFLAEQLKYHEERWLATAIYDQAGNFVGVLDPKMDSQRDFNYTGQPIEFGNYIANPDHKSIPVREVPDQYWRCLVYHEDRHMGSLLNPFGIDLIGVLKIPASSLMRTARAGKPRLGVGGSTLPMQLARVIFNTPPRADESSFDKLRRKLSEWWIAPVIQRELTRGDQRRLKEWTANHLWLAQRAGGGPLHGMEVTSRVVFGKEARDLSIAEQFVLASAVNRPIILQEGSERLNEVRLSHWRYITEVRARRCAEALISNPDEQKAVLFELVKLAGGPPDPVVRPKLQMALEEFAPQLAKPAMANPVLRANVLIPDVRYGVREEMKGEFGLDWRSQVRGVNLTLDVAENRHFRVRVESELARLQSRFGVRLDSGFVVDPKLARGKDGDRKLPSIIVVAADRKGEIVRYYEADENASYFGSPFARDRGTGVYHREKEARAIASIGKIVAAIVVANAGQDAPETPWTDSAAPENGLETCRKGNGTVVRTRLARVAFACSLSKPIEWRLAQLGQERVRKTIDALGLTLPPAVSASEATPPSTAAVRGLLTASPQKVHQMAAVVLAALSGDGKTPVRLPTLVRGYDLTGPDRPDEEAQKGAIVPDEILKPEARALVRTLLQAPLCYRLREAPHGTLRSLANWCAERRADLKLHFAKTGTHVTEDPDAIVDVWIAGGIQFTNGAAYSYVVLVGTGSTRQPFARKLHSSELAAPLAELLLQDLAQHAVQSMQVAKSSAFSAVRDPADPRSAKDVRKDSESKGLWWQNGEERKRIFGDRS
ncbi:MAG: glycosyl transferase family 51 [Hyphomicrobiaceae bacterium]|nr:MAG: glycosyl transferase family 51 [Hyphomicrobiaceae bacterium]